MTDPKVTIVIPSLNQGEFIEEAIQSVLSQDYPNVECVVIDGGSTDQTLDILKSYEPDIRWVSEPDGGQPDAINKGWRMADGDILTWLNADDMLCASAVSKCVEFMESYPEADAAYGDHLIVDSTGKLIRRRYGIPFDFRVILLGICYICPAIFIRREVFDSVGPLNSDGKFPLLFDYEYYLRLYKHSKKLAHIPEFLFKFRWQPESLTMTAVKRKKEEIREIQAMYRDDPFNQIPLLNELSKVILNRYYRLRRQYLQYKYRGRIDLLPGKIVRWYHTTLKRSY